MGPYILGEGEQYSGDFGESRESGVARRERGFAAGPESDSGLGCMADGCDSSFAPLGLVRLRLSYPRLTPWAVLCRGFAAIHGGLEPQGGARIQPTAQA